MKKPRDVFAVFLFFGCFFYVSHMRWWESAGLRQRSPVARVLSVDVKPQSPADQRHFFYLRRARTRRPFFHGTT